MKKLGWRPRIGTVWSFICLLLSASGGFSKLKPGMDGMEEVRHHLGAPPLQWAEPDGGLRWVYAQGPSGLHTWMANFDSHGRLTALEQVLDEAHFARVVPGQSDTESVMRLLGPPMEKLDFERRDEQTWEWRYRDQWLQLCRFVVTFERATWRVKSTFSYRELRRSILGD